MSRNKPKTRVKTAKRRKTSSTRWLQRQLNDPYVAEAGKQGYRGRAAFKLKEIDDKLKILKPGHVVLDLGAAPGGWCQVAAEKDCRVIAIDLLPMDEVPGVRFLQMDFLAENAEQTLKTELLALSSDGLADIVLSDMAPNTTGHKQTDHIRIMAIVEEAYYFALDILKPKGSFIAKVFQGGTEKNLLADMKKNFEVVRHIKPPSSRKESSEQYVVATGFRG